jgi:hypothetical protein
MRGDKRCDVIGDVRGDERGRVERAQKKKVGKCLLQASMI